MSRTERADIHEEIDQLRYELNMFSSEETADLCQGPILEISQKLDVLIVDYYRSFYKPVRSGPICHG
ncbi:hypothetical protein DNH61_13130 [Paenibacillus sambharensis]|uniref:Aspartyl-phosphate phosphatase Spo0E family protein n=1 Tax=Paenibacillus sambharensis TaxID=1803190 RepID=A0A2W1LUL2_9BACL|nr:aspartyl-phosphate phosphatase Spo0E family protein [Paenibacillus sambharensis]PZD95471.1 hypothetical protein DNH61_13130 [Paenibacillus sambharensis]